MKKFLVFIPVALLTFNVSFLPARAEESRTVQRALDSTKQYLDDLVTAKDEGLSDDVGLRADTFRKVLDLSSAEVKDFEFKLLSADKDPAFESWKKKALDGLTKALVFFDSEKDLVSDAKSLSLEKMKTIARDFKDWRDQNYLPLASQIQDFLLIKQEVKAIQTAQIRLDKITGDIKGIKRLLGSASDGITASILKSKKLIGEANDLNNQAAALFIKNYVNVLSEPSSATSTASSTTTSTVSSSSQDSKVIVSLDKENSSSTATSTSIGGVPSNFPVVSIKDLVKSSLSKIKEAYQGFIDISSLVRKLLK